MAEKQNLSKLSRADALAIMVTGLLLILLVPVLFAKSGEQDARTTCSAHLAQIGKAMLLYAGDNAGVLPRAGGPSTVWGSMPHYGWIAADRRAAFGLAPDGTGGKASISASFYLLVKYRGVSPKLFVCPADRGTTEFKILYTTMPNPPTLIDFWDFGPPIDAFRHCSYAYHMPYAGPYALTTSRDPNLAVAADRSPWIGSPAAHATEWTTFTPDIPMKDGVRSGSSDQARRGNSITHQRDGQNVLFLDGRVMFQTRPYCGVEKDNIYTVSRVRTGGDAYGYLPAPGPACIPTNRADSVLVHDPDAFPRERRPSRK